MKTKSVLVAILMYAMAVINVVSADTIRGISMDFVTIGNPGNTADTGGTPGCGAVSYGYRIGKYEVTNAQWNTFTAAAGAPTGNPSIAYDIDSYYTGAQQPTNVSWYETLQFCNYLTSGDKSKGVYLFSGNNTNPGDFLGIDRDSATSAYGTAYVIPTEDEWYKAAYFKPNGSGYSLYANGLDTIPAADNGWNYSGGLYSSPWDVGTSTMEQNGTYDMMGNVWEWNENLFYGSDRGLCGGSFIYGDVFLASSSRSIGGHLGRLPTDESYDVGFRVAEIPEPASVILISAGFFFVRSRRKQS
jgi:sulfatase modifying factor 1